MATQLKLDPETERLIDDLLASGRFAKRMDVVRYGVELAYADANKPLEAETLAAIERGLADVQAGRTRPAEDVFRGLRAEFGVER